MKKCLVLLLVLALVFGLASSAFADYTLLYAARDGVLVYAARDKNSAVYKTLAKGTAVLIEQSVDSWYATLVEDPGGSGQVLGWIPAADLSTVPPCSHDWSEWVVTKEPSCTAKGMRERVCQLCGEKETQELEKKPHNYGNWIVRREASCTEEGEVYHRCKVCGFEEKLAIEKLPHSYGDWVVLREPTCTAKGLKARWCTVCGFEKTKDIDKLPHSYGPWSVVVEATDHSAGVEEHSCQVCGHSQRRSFDPDGTLRRGDKGSAVREIQQLLVDQGYLSPDKADGSFGGGTEKAIVKFQKDQGLTPDGVAWPETIRRLHHDFGEWTVVTELSRYSDGESVRVCRECGYTEHRYAQASPCFERGDKGDGIKAIQRMLNELGFDCGKTDGAFGGKLERAWEAFALENGFVPAIDRLRPGDLDALTRQWLCSRSESAWKGQGDKSSPVNLILTVSPAGEENGMLRFNWMLSNLGGEKSRFLTLMLSPDKVFDVEGDNLVLVIDSARLKANGDNRLTGSFTVPAAYIKDMETPYFFAIAATDGDGAVWASNPIAAR